MTQDVKALFVLFRSWRATCSTRLEIRFDSSLQCMSTYPLILFVTQSSHPTPRTQTPTRTAFVRSSVSLDPSLTSSSPATATPAAQGASASSRWAPVPPPSRPLPRWTSPSSTAAPFASTSPSPAARDPPTASVASAPVAWEVSTPPAVLRSNSMLAISASTRPRKQSASSLRTRDRLLTASFPPIATLDASVALRS